MSKLFSRLKAAPWSVARYLHAVASAVRHPELPLAHIVLHPLVPTLKYVVPVGALVGFGHWAGFDAMAIRMMADEDARLRNLERAQREAEAKAVPNPNAQPSQAS